MTSLSIAVVLIFAIAIIAICLVAVLLLFRTGSLRDLRYVAEVVRAFRKHDLAAGKGAVKRRKSRRGKSAPPRNPAPTTPVSDAASPQSPTPESPPSNRSSA